MSQSHEYVFTREQIRAVDAEAISEYGIPGIVLMENASRGLALQALRMLGWPHAKPDARVLIICGGGNNGGDGLAAARHLHNAGLEVGIVLTKPIDSYTGEAEINLNICRAMKLDLVAADKDPIATLNDQPPCHLILDGLLGTGLTSDVRAPLDEVIGWINQNPAPTLAIDIPSGLDCDTGKALGCAVRAAVTDTFVGIKQGFTAGAAHPYLGEVTVTDIGVPTALIEKHGRPMHQ
ncbi:NAD(P)H-hydrate epimerase [Planctomycetales bacterium ZRK34]|nr:NAD(P)H-hydrate epimerase [Planctomycetales bacterium ZRK34]